MKKRTVKPIKKTEEEKPADVAVTEVKPDITAAVLPEPAPVVTEAPVVSAMNSVPVTSAPETAPAKEARLETVAVEETPAKPAEISTSLDNLAKIVDSSSANPVIPPESVAGSGDKKTNLLSVIWLLMSFLLGLALGLFAGYIVWSRGALLTKPVTTVTRTIPRTTVKPTPLTMPTVSVTPTPVLVKSSLKIEVLNGSGGKGVAAIARDLLTGDGYKSISVGNAQTTDFTQTEIAIKVSKAAYLDGLKKDLSAKYSVSDSTTDLEDSNPFDVIVTIGSK